jgi:N6-L-threonylcarbamoyladenine synthase
VGGVAANRGLREHLTNEAAEHGLGVYLPDLSLCGDNAAMIAAAGYHQLLAGHGGTLKDDVYSRSRAGLPG